MDIEIEGQWGIPMFPLFRHEYSVAEGGLDGVNFREGWLVCFVANSREVDNAEDNFDGKLGEVELADVDQAREEGYWGSIDGFRGL
jgi:hypothetical protein